jgi:predicted Zn-dependent protease
MNLSLAEYAFATGDIKRAEEHITLALKKLPKGTPAYRRAEDLMAQLKLAKDNAP